MIHQELPLDRYIKHIETSTDIGKIKEQLIKNIRYEREAQKSTIETNIEFRDMLLAIAISNALFLFFLVRELKKYASNK